MSDSLRGLSATVSRPHQLESTVAIWWIEAWNWSFSNLLIFGSTGQQWEEVEVRDEYIYIYGLSSR